MTLLLIRARLMPDDSKPSLLRHGLVDKWNVFRQSFIVMTDLMFQIIERKKVARRDLAQLPVGEKLRMLEKMVERDRKIAVTRPPNPANPVRTNRT